MEIENQPILKKFQPKIKTCNMYNPTRMCQFGPWVWNHIEKSVSTVF